MIISQKSYFWNIKPLSKLKGLPKPKNKPHFLASYFWNKETLPEETRNINVTLSNLKVLHSGNLPHPDTITNIGVLQICRHIANFFLNTNALIGLARRESIHLYRYYFINRNGENNGRRTKAFN